MTVQTREGNFDHETRGESNDECTGVHITLNMLGGEVALSPVPIFPYTGKIGIGDEVVWHAQPLHENSGGSGDPNIQKWC